MGRMLWRNSPRLAFARNTAILGRSNVATRVPFGGTLGGPIRKNKTFFSGSYEGTRIRRGFTHFTIRFVKNADGIG
jgi:hypothetical protein